MNRQTILITVGSLAALGAGASIYANVRQGRKDQLATELIREIQKVLQPSSAGLMAERAFEIHYGEEVLASISGKIIQMSMSQAYQLAKEIHSAFGNWWQGGDDEEKLYGIFRSLKDKVQVSQVANAYYDQYRINLIDKLYEKLNKQEVGIILAIVNELPAYRKSI